ncbi:MAG: hypothetical protein J1F12_03780 [Muribaculaceae bacterium]|nr:hypothetical protein [Muribaculaceae bacterium]
MSSSKIFFFLALISLFSYSLEMNGQKVFMTGDSHVFAKIYPQKTEEVLRSQHPDIDFGYWAKNGICFYSFNSNPEYYDSIFNFKPDILIVHLGTNGAYDNSFSRPAFREEMENFYSTLTDTLPDVKVVFITPFTNKKRKYRKKGKWRINYKNRDVADEIIAFTEAHPTTFVIDNNAEAGLSFLKTKGLIRTDNVHLTEKGYTLLGEQVGKHLLEIDELWASPTSDSPSSLQPYQLEITKEPENNFE